MSAVPGQPRPAAVISQMSAVQRRLESSRADERVHGSQRSALGPERRIQLRWENRRKIFKIAPILMQSVDLGSMSLGRFPLVWLPFV